MTSIKVPPLGESIVEATISRWLKNEGDAIAAGDTIVELETDKITVEVPALVYLPVWFILQLLSGVAAVGAATSAQADSAETLWRRANQALLEAKQPPKNRVVFSPPRPAGGAG